MTYFGTQECISSSWETRNNSTSITKQCSENKQTQKNTTRVEEWETRISLPGWCSSIKTFTPPPTTGTQSGSVFQNSLYRRGLTEMNRDTCFGWPSLKFQAFSFNTSSSSARKSSSKIFSSLHSGSKSFITISNIFDLQGASFIRFTHTGLKYIKRFKSQWRNCTGKINIVIDLHSWGLESNLFSLHFIKYAPGLHVGQLQTQTVKIFEIIELKTKD